MLLNTSVYLRASVDQAFHGENITLVSAHDVLRASATDGAAGGRNDIVPTDPRDASPARDRDSEADAAAASPGTKATVVQATTVFYAAGACAVVAVVVVVVAIFVFCRCSSRDRKRRHGNLIGRDTSVFRLLRRTRLLYKQNNNYHVSGISVQKISLKVRHCLFSFS